MQKRGWGNMNFMSANFWKCHILIPTNTLFTDAFRNMTKIDNFNFIVFRNLERKQRLVLKYHLVQSVVKCLMSLATKIIMKRVVETSFALFAIKHSRKEGKWIATILANIPRNLNV